MLKLPCNGVDRVHLMSQCGFMGRPTSFFTGRSSVKGFRSTKAYPVQAVASAKDGAVVNRVEPDIGSLANRLRLGSLSEDGLSYKEKFIVRSYEVGINKTATVETIANLLQEVGCNHAQIVGFSTDGFATTTTMRKYHLIWVTARMHIEVYKYPAWSDVVEIETWCQAEGRAGTRRDFIIKDYATNEVIGRATSKNIGDQDTDYCKSHKNAVNSINTSSKEIFAVLRSKFRQTVAMKLLPKRGPCKWVMMNEDTRRLQKVSDDVRDEFLVYCPRELRLAIPEENSNCLKKIPKLGDPAHNSRLGLMPRRSDLDMNQHVNNVAYIGWVLESMPQEIIDSYELQSITLDYRRECQQNDIVDSLTSLEAREGAEIVPELKSTNGSSKAMDDKQERQQFLHLLRLSNEGLEINRGRTEWRKKVVR